MAENSKIEWTDHTFNPWIGCTKVSPGCEHCYAEAMMDTRLGKAKWGAGQPRTLTSDKNWQAPIKWNQEAAESGVRYRVFCASLADVFDNEVPAAWRERLFDLIRQTPHLDWLLLTKRIGNASKMLPWGAGDEPWPNVWLGATIVNQEEADRDIDKLIATNAAIRFLSMEPLLDYVDLTAWLFKFEPCPGCPCPNPTEGAATPGYEQCCNEPELVPSDIDWVIVGGESGNLARPMHIGWVRTIRDHCEAANVNFLFKQWGEYHPCTLNNDPNDYRFILHDRDLQYKHINNQLKPFVTKPSHDIYHHAKLGKHVSGRSLDDRHHDQFPVTFVGE